MKMITHNNKNNTLYSVIILCDNYQPQLPHSTFIPSTQPTHSPDHLNAERSSGGNWQTIPII